MFPALCQHKTSCLHSKKCGIVHKRKISQFCKDVEVIRCLFMDYFTLYSVSRQFHSFFQSQFPTQCDLVLPLLNIFCPRSSSGCLSLLPRLPVPYFIPPPPIFPSITCFRRQFLRKMWPIQLAFLNIYFLYDIPLFLHSMPHSIFHTIGPTDLFI